MWRLWRHRGNTMTVSFDMTDSERSFCSEIAARSRKLGNRRPKMDIAMDVAATHCNGCPLRLEDLLAADDFNFCHDIGGVARHLNRSTGKLSQEFSPRYSRPEK